MGMTATAGIGTNLYLCKVAMDILAKHVEPDHNGVRIAELNEISYRRLLWTHQPITDFWRVGQGYAKKLLSHGIYNMGDVARCSIGKETDYYNEELLYRLFGVNAELLIDHAWGWEPCTIAQVKAYKPESNSIGSGQVLYCPYDFQKTRLIIKEMTALLALDFSIVSLCCKYSFFIKSRFIKLMIHISSQYKIFLAFHNIIKHSIKRQCRRIKAVHQCMF